MTIAFIDLYNYFAIHFHYELVISKFLRTLACKILTISIVSKVLDYFDVLNNVKFWSKELISNKC